MLKVLEWWPTIEEWAMPFHPLLINGGISYLGICYIGEWVSFRHKIMFKVAPYSCHMHHSKTLTNMHKSGPLHLRFSELIPYESV